MTFISEIVGDPSPKPPPPLVDAWTGSNQCQSRVSTSMHQLMSYRRIWLI